MRGRRRRSREQLLDDFKKKRRYWKLKEEALDRPLWRPGFGRSYGLVVRQTMDERKLWHLMLCMFIRVFRFFIAHDTVSGTECS